MAASGLRSVRFGNSGHPGRETAATPINVCFWECGKTAKDEANRQLWAAMMRPTLGQGGKSFLKKPSFRRLIRKFNCSKIREARAVCVGQPPVHVRHGRMCEMIAC
jgi:hypothetical protein